MQEKERLKKVLRESGACSRRVADRLIEPGAVTVTGEPAVTGMRVSEEDTVLVKGKKIRKKEEMVLLLMNKPRGLICTAQTREKPNIIEYLNYPVRVYPVGRLDKESEGLLLLTNNGDLVNRIMRAGNFHEKEYRVWVDRPIDQEFIKKMSGGVPILNTVTRPCKVRKTGKNTFSIILTQGLNRQIRRMCEYLGYQVKRLVRVRIMNLRLNGIETGAYRRITDQEYRELQELLKDSTSLSWKERL